MDRKSETRGVRDEERAFGSRKRWKRVGWGVCGPWHAKSGREQAGGYLLLIETYEQLFSPEKSKAEAALCKKEKNVRQKQSKG